MRALPVRQSLVLLDQKCGESTGFDNHFRLPLYPMYRQLPAAIRRGPAVSAHSHIWDTNRPPCGESRPSLCPAVFWDQSQSLPDRLDVYPHWSRRQYCRLPVWVDSSPPSRPVLKLPHSDNARRHRSDQDSVHVEYRQ